MCIILVSEPDDDIYSPLFNESGAYSPELLVDFCMKTLIEFTNVLRDYLLYTKLRDYVLYTKNLLLDYYKIKGRLLKDEEYQLIFKCLNLSDNVMGLALGHINNNYFLKIVFKDKDKDNLIRFSKRVSIMVKSYVLLDRDSLDPKVKSLKNIEIIKNSGVLTILCDNKIISNPGVVQYILDYLKLSPEINLKLYIDLKEWICVLTLEQVYDNITMSKIEKIYQFLKEKLKEIKDKINDSFILDLNKYLEY